MQTQNYQFSYVITYKHSADRLNLLRKTIAWLYTTGLNPELIIVEQGDIPALEEQDHRAKHYTFLKNEGQFHKSWAYNVGAKHATTDTIIFGDSDLIMDLNEFKKALVEFKTKDYDVVNPYKSVVDLQPAENGLSLDNLKKISRPGRGETDIQKVPFCGGITIWKKSAVDKVAGWCEDFIGWGGEDDAQSVKVEKMKLKSVTMPFRCYHLFHQRVVPNQQYYNRNLQVLQQIKALNDQQMVNWINTNRAKIGNPNLYE